MVALATYPIDAAASRFRICQFIPALAANGVDVTFLPFIDNETYAHLYDRRSVVKTSFALGRAILRRVTQLPRMAGAGAVWIQREAMLVGPPVVEWLITRVARRPMILDLDDATWIEVKSPVYGSFANFLKGRGKADRLIRMASVVICGNERIADYVAALGKRTVILPTIVDLALFRPLERRDPDRVPLIGWIGSHSTYPYFQQIIPVLERLARHFRFRVRVVGSGRDAIAINNVEVEVMPWRREREVDDFRGIDIGVYPLQHGQWEERKSGFKAIQYMSVGVPFVASPVGVVATIGKAGETHLLAQSDAEWYDALRALLTDKAKRSAMGAAGRAFAEREYSVDAFAKTIGRELRRAGARQP